MLALENGRARGPQAGMSLAHEVLVAMMIGAALAATLALYANSH